MPQIRGISVHVTDPLGDNLQEWGVQHLRKHTKGERVSAYIQSTADASFQVSVQPELPFIDPDTLSHNLENERLPKRNLRDMHGKLTAHNRGYDED